MNLSCSAGLLLLLSVASGQAQWLQWKSSLGGNDHWYRGVHVDTPISWITASNQANAQGSNLATITSQAEDDFVFRLINKPAFWYGEMGPLLGGFQPPGSVEPAGGWRWVTGEPWGYTHWAGGQPDDAAGAGEDVAHYWRGYQWNDIGGKREIYFSYVMERETPPVETLITVTQVGISWMAASNQQYQVFYRSDFTTNFWAPLTTNVVIGTGERITIHDSVDDWEPQRFYDVRKVE